MRRCNRPAVLAAGSSGFHVCRSHAETVIDACPIWHPCEGRCDVPIEDRASFWRRVAESRRRRLARQAARARRLALPATHPDRLFEVVRNGRTLYVTVPRG